MSVAQLAGGRVPRTARRASRRPALVTAAVVVLALLVAAAVVGTFASPYDPTRLFVGQNDGPITWAHPFGTDDVGRDILSRVLTGAATSLLGPLAIVALSTVAGVLLAVVAAWYGGVVRAVIARIVDVIFAIPGLVMAVLAVAMFGRGTLAPVIALSIAYVPVVVRMVQTAASRELDKSYMAALHIQGVSSLSMVFKHLLPALTPVVAAQLAVEFGYAMLDLASISFLGLGARPPAADWGSLVSAGQSGILIGAPEQSVLPALLIVITVLAVGIIGARITTWAEEKDS